MTDNPMTTDELRVRLMELDGWEVLHPKLARDGYMCRKDGSDWKMAPWLSELVRQAEAGLTEDEQDRYILMRLRDMRIFSKPSLKELWQFDQQSDETRAAALIEVMKASGVAAPAIRGHEDNSSTQNPG